MPSLAPAGCPPSAIGSATAPPKGEGRGSPRFPGTVAAQRQSTALASAEQTWCIRSPLRRPRRSVNVPTDTLSTESRLTAERRGTGSSPTSSTTSLGSPRMTVVHGAIKARRRRGIATSRDRTTTGRREISGSSHHQTSPLEGCPFTTMPPPCGRSPDHPTHRPHQSDTRRRPHRQRRSDRHDGGRAALQGLHRAAWRRSTLNEAAGHPRAAPHPPWY